MKQRSIRGPRWTWALWAPALLPTLAVAQMAPADAWRYSASVYAFVPSVSGSSSVPADSGGTPIEVSIIDTLKFAAMGSFGAHNGRWGVFTDFVYFNLGGRKQNSRDFSLGNAGLPANTTADLGWDLKGALWTLAGEVRAVSEPTFTLDALAGARLLTMKQSVDWNISGSLGPVAPDGRIGSSEIRANLLDAVVGAKGRAVLDAERKWSVPFYIDIGAGESKFTWQTAAGISYAYAWGELTAMWRYVGYDLKPGHGLTDLNFSGPMVGATFRW